MTSVKTEEVLPIPTKKPLVAPFCQASYSILNSYYHYRHKPQFDHFILPPSAELGNAGRVLVEHDKSTNEIFLGLQFGTVLEQALPSVSTGAPKQIRTAQQIALKARQREQTGNLSCHLLAVIAEETSHFQALCDAAEADSGISVLNLEVLGEIDRFLTLMHWNDFKKDNATVTENEMPDLPHQWRNLHDLCDFMFSGKRFHENTNPLYFDAEALALQHLKKAFFKEWDCSRTDFTRVSKNAQIYLQRMRSTFFWPRLSQFHDSQPNDSENHSSEIQHKSLPESA